MYIGFFPARTPGAIPDIQSMQTVASPVFQDGGVLVYSSNLVDGAGTDPTAIVGVALQGADTAPGFSQANSPLVSTGREQKVSVARANRLTVFRGKLTNNSSTFIAPVNGDLGTAYGITKYTIGTQVVWTVDKNKTSGGGLHRVSTIDIDTINNFVFFKFLEANLATP